MSSGARLHQITSFDTSLIEMGNWDPEKKELLLSWAKTGYEEKGQRASEIIGKLIPVLIGEDCSRDGKIYARKIGSHISNLEDLLETTKKGFTKKFYRDHLNHLIRVTILGKAIFENNSDFALSESDKKLFLISSIFHDISYPMSQFMEIYNGIIEALKNCYTSFEYPNVLVSFDMESVMKLNNYLILMDGMELKDLGKYFKKYNHALLSSLEFIKYIKNDRIHSYNEVIKTITYHDSNFLYDINSIDNKMLFLLILCDELQDWGRPSIYENEPTLTEITDFVVNDDVIQGSMYWQESSKLSPLRQITSKIRNISRLKKLDELKSTINISYILPRYYKYDYSTFENILKKTILSIPNPKKIFSELVYDIDTLEKRMFNEKGVDTIQIIDDLTGKKLSSPFKDYNFFVNELSKECWIINKKIGNPEKILMKYSKDNKINIVSNRGLFEQDIRDYENKSVKDIYKRIIREHSILNHITSEKSGGVPFKRSMFTFSELESLRTHDIIEDDLDILRNLKLVTGCILTRGLFVSG